MDGFDTVWSHGVLQYPVTKITETDVVTLLSTIPTEAMHEVPRQFRCLPNVQCRSTVGWSLWVGLFD